MNKRPKEIEHAIEIVGMITDKYYVSMYGWNKILRYIKQLEQSEQELLNMKERMLDDGKQTSAQ